MSKYIKIEWPESQEWLERVEYDEDFNAVGDIEPGPDMSVFVPEELLQDEEDLSYEA